MQNTLYTAEYIVPVAGPPIRRGAVHFRDGRIAAVGPAAELATAEPDAEQVDFGDAIIMPPLVNAHTHLELTDFPHWAGNAGSPDGFVDWILELIRIKHALEPQQLEQSVRNGINHLLRTGTGAVCDILSVASLDRLYAETPLHGWLCYELIGQDEGMGAVLPMMARDWLQEPKPGRLQRGLSPHSPYTVGPESLAQLNELASQHHVLTTIHTAESVEETDFLAASQGPIARQLYPQVGWQPPNPPLRQNSVDFIEAAGALHSRSLLVHGVQLDDDAIRRIGRAGCSLVLCPRSNQRLGVGRAPVESCRCQGVNLALGTDSMASNDSLSLWDEMEAAAGQYAGILSSVEIIAMATRNGSRALGLDDELGTLAAGQGGHFQVLVPGQLPDVDELAGFLCQGERGNDVRHLFLEGCDVLAAGELC